MTPENTLTGIAFLALSGIIAYLFRRQDKQQDEFSQYKDKVAEELKNYASLAYFEKMHDRLEATLNKLSEALTDLAASFKEHLMQENKD